MVESRVRSLHLAGRAPLLTAPPALGRTIAALDLGQLKWATPFDIVASALLYDQAVGRGVQPHVVLPEDEDVRRYLVDAGLPEHMPGNWGPGGGSVVEAPLVPLTHLSSGDDWDDELKGLWPKVRSTVGNFSIAEKTLDIISELVDNATSHGKSAVGTFVCVQRYTGAHSAFEPGIWIGIADGGIGIPAHLRHREKYVGIEADEELIRLARQPGVTGTRDRRGYGFHEVFVDAAAAGRSHLLIRSGRGEGDFRLRAGNRVRARYSRLKITIPGTWIHLRMEPS